MLTTLRQTVTIQKNGKIKISLADLKPGAKAEVIVLVEESEDLHKPSTGADLLASGLASSWTSRKDLGDRSDFARQLRQKAERQGHEA